MVPGVVVITTRSCMKHHNKISLGLVVLAAASSSPADALPVYFEFAGRVSYQSFQEAPFTPTYDLSLAGQVFNARIEFDTDLFVQSERADEAMYVRLLNTPGGATPDWTGYLNFASTDVNLQPFEINRVNSGFMDSRGMSGCGPACSHGDAFFLQAESFREDETTHLRQSASMFLSSAQIFDPEFPDASHYTQVDLAQPFSAEQLLTVPLPALHLNFSTITWNCEWGACEFVSQEVLGLEVSSLTRGVTSVPEPGTLGLLTAGLFASVFGRRKLRRA
jgi:hypothetical protein